MKRLALIATIALLLFSCKNDSMEIENSLIGIWEDTWVDEDGNLYFERFIFDNNKVTRETDDEQNTGTYEYDDEKIYFDYTNPNVFSIRANYSIENNVLTMTFLNTHKTYTYKKVK